MRLLIVPKVRREPESQRIDDFALTDGLVERIQNYLEPRRLLGASIEIATPYYQGVTVACHLRALPTASDETLTRARSEALHILYHWVNPLSGGPEGMGWRWDTDLNTAPIAQLLLQGVDAIERVDEVLLFECDLRTGRRYGPAREVVRLDDRSLFLCARATTDPGGRTGANFALRPAQPQCGRREMTVDDVSGNDGRGSDVSGSDVSGSAPDEAKGLPVPLATTSSALSSASPSSTGIVVTGPTGQPSSATGRRADWLVNQLPVGMLDDDFFYRFVSIFQEEAGTYLDGIDNLGNIVDPAVAPPSMVRFMAGWLALPPINPSLDETYQRHLVRAASKLLRWRGTQQGLKGILELITGGAVEIADNGGVFRQGEEGIRRPEVNIRVESTGWLPEAAFLEFVRDEVPANASVALVIGEREIWSLGALEGR